MVGGVTGTLSYYEYAGLKQARSTINQSSQYICHSWVRGLLDLHDVDIPVERTGPTLKMPSPACMHLPQHQLNYST